MSNTNKHTDDNMKSHRKSSVTLPFTIPTSFLDEDTKDGIIKQVSDESAAFQAGYNRAMKQINDFEAEVAAQKEVIDLAATEKADLIFSVFEERVSKKYLKELMDDMQVEDVEFESQQFRTLQDKILYLRDKVRNLEAKEQSQKDEINSLQKEIKILKEKDWSQDSTLKAPN